MTEDKHAGLLDCALESQRPHRIQEIHFEQGVACFTSPEYDAAAAFRRAGAGEVETIMVEGGDATR